MSHRHGIIWSSDAREGTLESTVVISVDPRFSPRGDDQDFDFWIVGIEANIREAAQRRNTDRVKSVTTFNDLGDDVTNVTSMLPTIIEHHPSTAVVIVRGIKADAHIDVIHVSPASWVGSSSDGDVMIRRDRHPH
jgi:hypothetical protein